MSWDSGTAGFDQGAEWDEVLPVPARPFIMTDPVIELDGQRLECLASHLEVAPEVNTVEVVTFCRSADMPSTETWYFRLTLYQSFDDEGTDEILRGCVNHDGPVDFRVVPYRGRPVGVNNPEFTGRVVPRKYAVFAGDAGEASEVELEWTLTGPPARFPAPTG